MLENLLIAISNKVKNTVGSKRDLLQFIADRDISSAKELFENNSDIVRRAMQEYDPRQHEVMKRKDKERDGQGDYIVEKLPRNWQEYINEIALFFLLANPISWKAGKEHSEAFSAFKDMLRSLRFDSSMRQFKRTAGSETQCAKLYRLYQDRDGLPRVEIVILSASNDWDVRPLFDRYGHLLAFGYGYYTKEAGVTVEHFDIETPDEIYRCKRGSFGVWDIAQSKNETRKINVIYAKQSVEWDNAQHRINRDEFTDSRIADTNNYFADPIAAATTDVVNSLPKQDTAGRLIQLNGADSDFRYINPPTAPELQKMEKEEIRRSILQDTFTPDFDFSKMVGLGTLSGEAIKRALILGYIKRARNIEIYEPLVDREKNLIIAIMQNVTHIGMKDQLEALKTDLTFEFSEPFSEDVSKKIQDLSAAVSAGILSVEEAVSRLAFTDNQEEELSRIMEAKKS